MSNEEVDPDVRNALMGQFNLDDKDDPLDEEKRSLSEDVSTNREPPTGDSMYEAKGDSPSVESMLQEVIDHDAPREVEDGIREELNRTHIDEDIIKNLLGM